MLLLLINVHLKGISYWLVTSMKTKRTAFSYDVPIILCVAGGIYVFTVDLNGLGWTRFLLG